MYTLPSALMAYHVNSLTALGAQTSPTSAISIQATFSQIYLHNHILSQSSERILQINPQRSPELLFQQHLAH